jgi:hypothetical protein
MIKKQHLLYKLRVCKMILATDAFIVVTDISHSNGHHFKYRLRTYNIGKNKIKRRLLDNIYSLFRFKIN